MSVLLSAIETVSTLVAAGYAAHRIENAALARKGYDTRDFFKPIPMPAAPVAEIAVPRWTKADEDAMIALFEANPLAWWLDPARWGTPDSFAPPKPGRTNIRGLVEPSGPIAVAAPPCPVCPDGGKRTVMNVHDGEATMWDCFVCGTEFTRAGETSNSKKRRHKRNGNFTVLPCGHTGDIRRFDNVTPSGTFKRTSCVTCHAEWDPQSNDTTGRSLGQGEDVTYLMQSAPLVVTHSPQRAGLTTPDDKTIQRAKRDSAWEFRVWQIGKGLAENHGSCPEPCGMPVDKRAGMYYCSDSTCQRHKVGWR